MQQIDFAAIEGVVEFEMVGDAVMILGDSIVIMAALIARGWRTDMILSDPPYKLTSGGPSDLGGCLNDENYNNDGSIVQCDIDWPDFMPLLSGILDQGHCYTMANNRNVQAMLNAASDAKFGFHNLLVWDKITAVMNRWYMKNCEFVGFFFKGHGTMITDCSSKQLLTCPQRDESHLFAEPEIDSKGRTVKKGHPTEKPVALMEYYIRNSSNQGDTVMDPFAGVGSTAIAAMKSGRRFVGIEIDPKWYKIAVKRMKHFESLKKQVDLFVVD